MEEIRQFLEENIRPALQTHGGDLEYVGFEASTGIVTVKYVGACAHCPSSSMSTHMAIENALTENFPDLVMGIERAT
jgi:Fe-S cluster biogenesis protein NfuA